MYTEIQVYIRKILIYRCVYIYYRCIYICGCQSTHGCPWRDGNEKTNKLHHAKTTAATTTGIEPNALTSPSQGVAANAAALAPLPAPPGCPNKSGFVIRSPAEPAALLLLQLLPRTFPPRDRARPPELLLAKSSATANSSRCVLFQGFCVYMCRLGVSFQRARAPAGGGVEQRVRKGLSKPDALYRAHEFRNMGILLFTVNPKITLVAIEVV